MQKHRVSRGVATTELALSLPLLTLLFFGALDACQVIFLRDTIELAAYEACREAAEHDLTTSDVRANCTRFLEGYGINEASIETSPAEVAAARPGDAVEVIVTTTTANRTFYLAEVFGDSVLEARATLSRIHGESPPGKKKKSRDDEDD